MAADRSNLLTLLMRMNTEQFHGTFVFNILYTTSTFRNIWWFCAHVSARVAKLCMLTIFYSLLSSRVCRASYERSDNCGVTNMTICVKFQLNLSRSVDPFTKQYTVELLWVGCSFKWKLYFNLLQFSFSLSLVVVETW